MLDHVFTQAVVAMRTALADALLQRTQDDEHLTHDLLTGEVHWETAYTLPGEAEVPRVQAGLTFEWSAWSQAAYRISLREPHADNEPLDLFVNVVFRVQRLANRPNPDTVGRVLPEDCPIPLPDRYPPTIEEQHDEPGSPTTFAIEFSYEGFYELPADVSPLGAWIASNLVRLADLDLAYVEP